MCRHRPSPLPSYSTANRWQQCARPFSALRVASFSWTAPNVSHERNCSVSRHDFPRRFDVMLRPLLLLCWAATIVSAGNPKDVTIAPADNPTNIAASPQTAPSPPNTSVETTLSPLPVSSDQNEHNVNPNESSNQTLPSPTTNSAPNSNPNKLPPPSPTTPPPPPITTKPATTSTPVPVTTVAPTTTPLPPPSSGKWTVKENNTLCIIVQMAVQLNISYTADNVTIHKMMDIPSSNGTTSTGQCGKIEQNLTLSWKSQDETVLNNFTIHFVKNETEKSYSLHHFEIFLAAAEFPNDKSNKTVAVEHVAPSFQTGLSNSYRCIKEQQLDLTFKNKNATVRVNAGLLKVSHLQFQAFRGDNTTIFGLAKDCSFDTPDIVPITVGCALAGLVVIVLIAYLVGRRRSQARGYLSM